MAGLFGGARRALSNFAQTDSQGRTFGDKLSLIGATLQDISDPDRGAVQKQVGLMGQRSAARERQMAVQRLNAALMGGQTGQAGQTPTPASLDLNSLAAGGSGLPDAPATNAPRSAGLPRLRDAAPALLAAQAAGIDIGDYVSLLDKTTPNVQVANGVAYDPQATAPGSRVGVSLQNVNGSLVDTQDPTNANRFVPNVAEGQ